MQAFPGLWELPLVMWNDHRDGRCSMADACSNPPDAEVHDDDVGDDVDADVDHDFDDVIDAHLFTPGCLHDDPEEL